MRKIIIKNYTCPCIDTRIFSLSKISFRQKENLALSEEQLRLQYDSLLHDRLQCDIFMSAQPTSCAQHSVLNL